MTVLSDQTIEQLAMGMGVIRPYDPAQLQPASYDLRLGYSFRILSSRIEVIDPTDKESLSVMTTRVVKKQGETMIVHPGEFMLGCTREEVRIPEHIVGRIEGKSTLGRCGLAVHITAGYLDPGFHGVITLEMANMASRPIVLHPGMFIAQLGLAFMDKPAQHPYRGRYQGDTEASPAKPIRYVRKSSL